MHWYERMFFLFGYTRGNSIAILLLVSKATHTPLRLGPGWLSPATKTALRNRLNATRRNRLNAQEMKGAGFAGSMNLINTLQYENLGEFSAYGHW